MQVVGLLLIVIIVTGAGLFVIGLIAITLDYLFNKKSTYDNFSLKLLIYTMIGGGAGFAIGNLFGVGWAIFGMILGGLIAVLIWEQVDIS